MKRGTLLTGTLVGACCLVLAGCGEQLQMASKRKADSKAYESATGSGFVAQGWQAGDASSWEVQLRKRAQSQNEYSRLVPTTP